MDNNQNFNNQGGFNPQQQGGFNPQQQGNFNGYNGGQPNNNLAICALVLGLVGIVFTFIPVFALTIIGLICAIVGLVISRKAQRQAIETTGMKSGMATAGFVLSLIAIIICAIGLIVGIVAIAAAASLVGAALYSLY